MSVVTRFAPSPTGDLHLGHVYAAWYARETAAKGGGRYLVRIEDIDTGRCREEFVRRNLDDLAWLGLAGAGPVLHQSQRLPSYRAALDRLQALRLVYPCFCTRGRIRAELEAAASAPHARADAAAPAELYPGTCRALSDLERTRRQAAGEPFALRLDSDRAQALAGPLVWHDRLHGPQTVSLSSHGDVVLARKEIGTSYHLCVVVDDAAQGVTDVTRGADLLCATHIHRLLYALLDLPVPVWHHHPLVRDERGRRLAKRSGDAAIASLRAAGRSPESVLAMARAAAGHDAPPG